MSYKEGTSEVFDLDADDLARLGIDPEPHVVVEIDGHRRPRGT